MSDANDPIRILDDDSEESAALRALLASTALDAPSEKERASLDARLAALLGTAGGGGAGGAGAAGGGAAAAAGKSALVAATGGVLAKVVLAGTVGAMALIVTVAFVSHEPPHADPGVDVRADRGASPPDRPIERTEAPPTSHDSSAGAPRSEAARPIEAPQPAPRARLVADVRIAPRRLDPAAQRVALEHPSVAVPEAASAPVLPDDLALLHRARAALSAGDPRAALDLVDELAREHPASDYTQEREAIAIEALANLGRGAEAQARFDRFVGRYPESTYRHRLGDLLAREPASISP